MKYGARSKDMAMYTKSQEKTYEVVCEYSENKIKLFKSLL